MSLINDALKRAKQAQARNEGDEASMGPPHLLPAEPRENLVRGIGLALPGALTLVALLVLLLVWVVYRGRQQGAGGVIPPGIKAQAKSEPVIVVRHETAAEPAPDLKDSGQPGAPVMPPGNATLTLQSTITPAGLQIAAVTNGTNLVLAAKPPQAVVLRLQSVVVHPIQGSAMINGRFLRIGERIAGYRLVAVTADSATLVNSGGTNVLQLSEVN